MVISIWSSNSSIFSITSASVDASILLFVNKQQIMLPIAPLELPTSSINPGSVAAGTGSQVMIPSDLNTAGAANNYTALVNASFQANTRCQETTDSCPLTIFNYTAGITVTLQSLELLIPLQNNTQVYLMPTISNLYYLDLRGLSHIDLAVTVYGNKQSLCNSIAVAGKNHSLSGADTETRVFSHVPTGYVPMIFGVASVSGFLNVTITYRHAPKNPVHHQLWFIIVISIIAVLIVCLAVGIFVWFYRYRKARVDYRTIG